MTRVNAHHAMSHGYETDTVTRLETNLDDCTGETLGAAMEALLAAGALDVWFMPIQMKKHRPGVQLSVLSEPDRADTLVELIFKSTSAFGLRRETITRVKLSRQFRTLETEYGAITVKLGLKGDEIVQVAPEYESCRAAADRHHVTVSEAFQAALRAYRPG
ncbi:MAG: nickel insertion protein [Chthoniobacteraceae bacterium]